MIWSIYFVEALKLSEQRFAIENGSHACERVELPRKEYVQEVVIQGKEEVEEVDSLDWIQSVRRHTTTFPIVLLFVILLSILVTAIYVLETLITESYSGPLKQFLVRSCSLSSFPFEGGLISIYSDTTSNRPLHRSSADYAQSLAWDRHQTV